MFLLQKTFDGKGQIDGKSGRKRKHLSQGFISKRS